MIEISLVFRLFPFLAALTRGKKYLPVRFKLWMIYCVFCILILVVIFTLLEFIFRKMHAEIFALIFAGHLPSELAVQQAVSDIFQSGRILILGGLVFTLIVFLIMAGRIIPLQSGIVEKCLPTIETNLGKSQFGNFFEKENPKSFLNIIKIGFLDEVNLLIEAVDQFDHEIKSITLEQIPELMKANAELKKAFESSLMTWVSCLDDRNVEPISHILRVADMTVSFAGQLGMNLDEISQMRYGAILHDVGKFKISSSDSQCSGDSIEPSSNPLRQHPIYAHNMLQSIPYLEKACSIPLYHHEHWDGSGYPQGVSKTNIPLAARVYSIIDCWESMIYPREGDKSWTRLSAVYYIESEAGARFDPDIVKAFIEWVRDNFYSANAFRVPIRIM